MNRILTLIAILLISSCGQQVEKKSEDRSITDADSMDIKKTISKNQIPENASSKDSLKSKRLHFSNGPSFEQIQLTGSTVLIVELDSMEIEQVKLMDGEGRFYTASDDLMWYNSMLIQKMDSLKIPVKYSDKDTIKIYSANFEKTLVKDSTFSLYTYFYFDGNEIQKKDLFELLGE